MKSCAYELYKIVQTAVYILYYYLYKLNDCRNMEVVYSSELNLLSLTSCKSATLNTQVWM